MSEVLELNPLNCDASVLPRPTKAEHLIQQLNANNAKKVALLLVLGFVAYHGILNWQYGKRLSLFLAYDTLHVYTFIYISNLINIRERFVSMAVI